VIEPRLYRAAFLPAVLAVVVAAFSLQDRPRALSADVSADILFDGGAAADEAGVLTQRFPQRVPGSEGDRSAAEYVSSELTSLGFEVLADRFTDGSRELVNVVGTRTGSTRERLVVMAPRDSFASPDLAGSAADTATLLQLARALEGRATSKTIVLVSYDGSALGQSGVRRFIETAEDRTRIGQVLALSNLGAAPPAIPGVVDWSENLRMADLGFTRTAFEALRKEMPNTTRSPISWSRLARAPRGCSWPTASTRSAYRAAVSASCPPTRGSWTTIAWDRWAKGCSPRFRPSTRESRSWGGWRPTSASAPSCSRAGPYPFSPSP